MHVLSFVGGRLGVKLFYENLNELLHNTRRETLAVKKVGPNNSAF